ncbi:unnamed protein product, partial [Rotaria sp. Silwood1]
MDTPDTSPSAYRQRRISATNRKSLLIDHQFLINLRRRSRELFKTNDIFFHELSP